MNLLVVEFTTVKIFLRYFFHPQHSEQMTQSHQLTSHCAMTTHSKNLQKTNATLDKITYKYFTYLCMEQRVITMNAIELKSDLHELIDRVNDMSMLNAIKTILSKQTSESDFWEELPLNVQESVKRGMMQVENGETRTHEEVMQKHNKWL